MSNGIHTARSYRIMKNIKTQLTTIITRLYKYSLEYNDFNDDNLFYDSEEYEDLSEVMNSQRNKLEDLSCELQDMLDDASDADKELIKAVHISVNEALNYIEEVAFKADCPWNLEIPEYDTEVTEAIDWIKDALTNLEDY